MHIAEGMLPLSYAAGYWAGASALVARGLWEYRHRARREPQVKQLTGVMTAAIFLISLLPIPVPVAGTCSHPAGTPLAAIMLGPWLTVVMSMVALLFQALFFAHGGLTTLGANTLTMGVFGGFAGWLVFWAVRRLGSSLFVAGAAAGLIGDVMVYIGTATQLALAIHGAHPVGEVFWLVLAGFMPTQAPLAIVEGLFTGYALRFLAARRPDILISLGVLRSGEYEVLREGESHV